ncbi:MAG: OmpA family protein, partial [Bacteroidota bacterium]
QGQNKSEDERLLEIIPPSTNIISDYGFFGNYNMNIHSVEFEKLPGIVNCCPQFSDGSGSGFGLNRAGFGLGIFAEIPFSGKYVFVPRLSYESNNGRLNNIESKILGINGKLYNGKIEHSIDLSFSTFALDLLFGISPIDKLYFYLGPKFDYHIKMHFEQKETLVEPADVGSFENNSRTRNVFSGETPNGNSFIPSVMMGAAYDLPLNRKGNIALSPFAFFSYGAGDLIDNYVWTINTVRIGAALKFKVSDNEPDTVYHTFVSMNTVALDENGKEVPLTEVFLVKNNACGITSNSSLNIQAIRFKPDIKTLGAIKQTEIIISRNNQEYRRFSENGKFNENIDWNLLPDTSDLFAKLQPLNYSMKVTSEDGQVFNTNGEQINFSSTQNELSTKINHILTDKIGNDAKQDTIRLYETISTNMRPLLNYVFFEKNSSIIPKRYEKISKEETESFRIENLRDFSTLDTYYKILNIIGRRMRENDTASILLTGCNSDAGVEEGNFGLSVQRAESVRRYLTNVWGISSKRIKVKGKNLPLTPSKTNEREFFDYVRDENRRVEISSDNLDIIQPVVTFDTLRSIEPAGLSIQPEIQSNVNLKEWSLAANLGKKVLIDTSSSGKELPTVKFDIEKNKSLFRAGNDRINLHFDAVTENGMHCKSEGSCPYKIQTTDSTLDRYSLILFDYNSYNLSDANNSIAGYINSRIDKDANGKTEGTVEITGFSDKIGAESHNLELSQKRAEALSKLLKLEGNVKTEGLGESNNLYPLDFPEGRFYSRTVTVIVKNPVKTKR